ncbi:hypothetical protein JCM8097_007089 [Rhodosporidiobolus ruineniae]
MPSVSVALLVVSDSVSASPSSDRTLPILRSTLAAQGDVYSITAERAVSDDPAEVRTAVEKLVEEGADLVLTSGGTGFGVRDNTPEVVSDLIDKPAPGLVTAMLLASLSATPLGALARPVAGVILSPSSSARSEGAGTLVVTLPGSPKGAKENLEGLLRVLPHALELAGGARSRGTEVHQRLEKGEDGMDGVKGASSSSSSSAVGEKAAGGSFSGHSCGHHHSHHHHGHPHGHGGGHHAPTPRTLLSLDPSTSIAARQRQSPWPLVSVREAMSAIFAHAPVMPVVTASVDEQLVGSVLASDVEAAVNIPQGPSTNIDGYAVLSTDSAPGVYKVCTSFPLSPLPSGTIYRINTGAPLPPGMDSCIMVEDTEVVARDEDGEEIEVRLLAQVEKGENVRKEGSDVRVGEKVLEKGDVVSAVGGELGTLAFINKRSVPVYRRPTVAVLSTGNELRDLQDTSSPSSSSTSSSNFSGIVDSNRPTLLSVLHALHYPTVDLGICGDSMADTVAALKRGKEQADLVITTGGTSMGVGDLLKPAIERECGGAVHFGRVAMKPGKPTTFATLPAHPLAPSRDPTLVFALPGNPASALVTFYLFVLPALRKMEGRREGEWELPRVPVTLTAPTPLDPRPEYHRVHLRPSRSSSSPSSASRGLSLEAVSTGGQRSSRTVSLAGANGLLELPARTEGGKERLEKGETVEAVVVGEIGVGVR